MTYKELEIILSSNRLGRYLSAKNNDQDKAIDLYFLSLHISGDCFKLISLFEVILRNKISDHLAEGYGIDWLTCLAQPGSILDIQGTRITIESVRQIRKTIDKQQSLLSLGQTLSNGKIISEMSFGFWTSLFHEDNYVTLGNNLSNIFVKLTLKHPQSRRTKMMSHLSFINQKRNRLAHNEALIFNKNNEIDFTDIDKLLSKIMLLLELLDVNLTICDEFVQIIEEGKSKILSL